MPEIPNASAKPKGPNAGFGLILLALSLVTGLGIGYVIGRSTVDLVPEGGDSAGIRMVGSFEEGYEEAHRRLLESGLVGRIPEAMTSVEGDVVSVHADAFVLRPDYRWPDPLDTRTFAETKTVAIDAETAITLITQKDPEVFRQEVDSYLEAGSEGPAPRPTTEERIALSDLQPGDRVTVRADEDILDGESFRATSIEIIVLLPDPEPPVEDEALSEEIPSDEANEPPPPTPEP